MEQFALSIEGAKDFVLLYWVGRIDAKQETAEQWSLALNNSNVIRGLFQNCCVSNCAL